MRSLLPIALAPSFWKGIGVIIASLVLFVGSVYILLGAVFGLRMAYLVLAVSFFGWMIILALLWTVGQPPILGVTGLLPNLGPRGTEAHWQVFAAGPGAIDSRYAQTRSYPDGPWHPPDKVSQTSVATATTAIQVYLVARAEEQLSKQGQDVCGPTPEPGSNCLSFEDSDFVVQDMEFATADDGTHLAAAHSFFVEGGPEVTVFAYHDTGNVPVYSISFLIAGIVGFAIHLPFLDRAERRRKEILTGGTAPPWYGPA